MPPFRFSHFIAVVFSFFALYSAVRSKWLHGYYKDIIAYDGQGYYSYLPAVFIYHDLTWNFLEICKKKYPASKGGFEFTYATTSGRINKYFCGTALLQFPFFLLAWFFSYIFGFDPDGYSILFQLAVSLAAVFYFSLGIYFLSRLLICFNVKRSIVTAVLILIAFGTNLFYYASSEPSMSHVYSFCAVSGFLLYLKLALEDYSYNHLLKCAVWYGIVGLLRPTNAIVILAFPVFAGDRKIMLEFMQKILANKGKFIIPLLALCLVAGIQLVLFYLQTGYFLAWSYGPEHFNFLHPELFNVLFSYKKGLFVYAPLIFVSSFGLYYLARENKFSAVFLFLELFLALYIISSWEGWWYGGSFGMRPFIDYYPFFALLLAYLLTRPSRTVKIAVGILCLFSLYNARLETLQYKSGMINFDGMDEGSYWKIFMKTPPKKHETVIVSDDVQDTSLVKKRVEFFNDFDSVKSWGNENTYTREMANSGNTSVKLSSVSNYSPSIEKKPAELGLKGDVLLSVSFAAFLEKPEGNEVLAINFWHGNESYGWHSYPLKDKCSSDTWCLVAVKEKLPALKSDTDRVQVYIYNNTDPPVYIDDLRIIFDEMK